MKNSAPIRWGIIGCGSVTEKKSGPALQQARDSELVAVMRRDGDLARDFARRHGVPRWYDDARLLVNDADVDVIYVATPPESHLHYALMSAKAGKPVYVEKPLALNHNQTQKMVKCCRENEVPLFTAYYRRALPRFLKVKILLEERCIGDVQGVALRLHRPPAERDLKGVAHWRINPKIGGNGYFFDLGSHMLDLIQFFFGPIHRALGYSENRKKLYQADDMVVASFDFESGLSASGIWCFYAADRVDCTEIIGTKGKISYATFSDEPIRLSLNGKVEEFNIPNPVHVQQPLIQSIVDQLTGKGECPSTGVTGAHTNWVMEQVLKKL